MTKSKLLTEQKVAVRLGVSTRTLQRWRAAGHGPKFQRLPGDRLIRYHETDIARWERKTQPAVAA